LIRIAERVRELRRNQTEAEKRIWKHLRNRQLEEFKFYRQVQIGNYVVDFVCRDLDLIIEIDGGQHCENNYDLKRTKDLESFGYKVIRFWNNEVLENTEGVLEVIKLNLMALTPALSLKGEGEIKA
jgi:very-short-patch-repair endonuclease